MKNTTILFCLLFFPFAIQAQYVKAKSSDSQTDTPQLEWEILEVPDSLPSFTVFRAPHDSKEFEQIETVQYFYPTENVLTLGVIDTTLTIKGVWQYYIKVEFFEAPAVNSDIMYAHNMGFLAPPEIFNFNTKPISGRKAIELNWDLRNPSTVISQSIFRSRHPDDEYELITRLAADARSYIDEVNRSNEPWFYFILIHDYFGYQPPSVRVYGFSNYAEEPLPPYQLSARQQEKDVVLSWKKMGDNIFSYHIYRRDNGEGKFYPLGDPFYLPGDELTRTDSLAVDETIHSLEYYCISISDGYIESQPSDTVFLFFPENMAVFPPPELDYVLEPEGQTRLFWGPPEYLPGITGYNIYRIVNGGPAEKLNEKPVRENTFLDVKSREVGTIVYQVEALNPAGHPSDRRTEVSLEAPLLQTRLVLSCSQTANDIQLKWIPLSLEGIKTFKLLRQTGDEEPSLLARISNETGAYNDTQISSGNFYIYYVVAEMYDGREIMVNNGIGVFKH